MPEPLIVTFVPADKKPVICEGWIDPVPLGAILAPEPTIIEAVVFVPPASVLNAPGAGACHVAVVPDVAVGTCPVVGVPVMVTPSIARAFWAEVAVMTPEPVGVKLPPVPTTKAWLVFVPAASVPKLELVAVMITFPALGLLTVIPEPPSRFKVDWEMLVDPLVWKIVVAPQVVFRHIVPVASGTVIVRAAVSPVKSNVPRLGPPAIGPEAN